MSGRILVLDTDVEGDEHVPFNAGLLAAVLAAAPGRAVEFHPSSRLTRWAVARSQRRDMAIEGGSSIVACARSCVRGGLGREIA
jgi:ferric-dicitrate binding protein FerR (iron transport regulator)